MSTVDKTYNRTTYGDVLTDEEIREKYEPLCTALNPDGHKFPSCPFLKKNICTYLTDHIGFLYPVNPIFCKTKCKKGGPYCGKNEGDYNDFLLYSFNRLNAGYMGKVYDRFQRKPTIVVPLLWPTIKESLKHLYDNSHFSRILLSGSVIVKGVETLKDLDIVLEFDDLSYIIDNTLLINNKLPTTIADYPVDYFVKSSKSNSEDLFFTYLDPELKTFYTTKWFDFDYDAGELSVIKGDSDLVKKVVDTYETTQDNVMLGLPYYTDVTINGCDKIFSECVISNHERLVSYPNINGTYRLESDGPYRWELKMIYGGWEQEAKSRHCWDGLSIVLDTSMRDGGKIEVFLTSSNPTFGPTQRHVFLSETIRKLGLEHYQNTLCPSLSKELGDSVGCSLNGKAFFQFPGRQ